VGAQHLLAAFVLIPISVNAHDFIPSIIGNEVVYEFGDFGKAVNQYPTSVGDLNVISSTIVTTTVDSIIINDSFSANQQASPQNLPNKKPNTDLISE